MLFVCIVYFLLFLFKHKTAYDMRISDWSSDVCSSDLFFSSCREERRPDNQPITALLDCSSATICVIIFECRRPSFGLVNVLRDTHSGRTLHRGAYPQTGRRPSLQHRTGRRRPDMAEHASRNAKMEDHDRTSQLLYQNES